MWPFWDLAALSAKEAEPILSQAEFTVYQNAIAVSRDSGDAERGKAQPTGLIELPASYRFRIIPDEIYERRKHSDVRIARRAETIAALARGTSASGRFGKAFDNPPDSGETSGVVS